MAIAEKLQTVAEKQQNVYDAGYRAGAGASGNQGYDSGYTDGYNAGYSEGEEQGVIDYKEQYVSDLWDGLQPNGAEPTLYQQQFCGESWTDDIFKPKHDIVFNSYGTAAFCRNYLTDLREQTIGVKIDFSRVTNFSSSFQATKKPMLIDEINTTSCSSLGPFLYQASFKYIGKMIFKDDGSQTITASQFMAQIDELEEVRFEGVFGANNANLSRSPKLSVESLVSWFNCLKDYSDSGSAYKTIIGSTNMAKLTEEQLDIARNKGWEVS